MVMLLTKLYKTRGIVVLNAALKKGWITQEILEEITK